MINRYPLFAFLAIALAGCGVPAEPPPPHDAGSESDAASARPCFPGEGVSCPSGAVPYCYPNEPGGAPFDNCAPSCGEGKGDSATSWCCPLDANGPPPVCTVTLDGGPG